MKAIIANSELALSVALTASASQPPGAPAPSAVAEPAATAYFIKFKVKLGKNAEFEKVFSEVMVGVRENEPGNVYCDLLHLSQDPHTNVIMERFKDVDAVKTHSESEYIKKLGATLNNDLLDGPPERQDLVYIRSK